jgi:hypothetical protein
MAILADLDTNHSITSSWSAKADHPRVFVFSGAPQAQKTTKNKEKRGWPAFADHDEVWV